MSALQELLLELAALDLRDPDVIDDAPGHAPIRRWQEAGCPGVPQCVPVPADYDGLCVLEVEPQWRSGRGRFWRPFGHGYTNDEREAGLFTMQEVRDRPRGKVRPKLPGTTLPTDNSGEGACENRAYDPSTGTWVPCIRPAGHLTTQPHLVVVGTETHEWTGARDLHLERSRKEAQ